MHEEPNPVGASSLVTMAASNALRLLVRPLHAASKPASDLSQCTLAGWCQQTGADRQPGPARHVEIVCIRSGYAWSLVNCAAGTMKNLLSVVLKSPATSTSTAQHGTRVVASFCELLPPHRR